MQLANRKVGQPLRPPNLYSPIVYPYQIRQTLSEGDRSLNRSEPTLAASMWPMLTFLVQDQGKLIVELITFNQRTHKSIEDLNTRVQMMEFATTPGMHPQRRVQPALASPFEPTFSTRDSARSRSPSPDRQGYRMREESVRFKKNKDTRSLQISIPGKMYMGPIASLPTPMTLSVCLHLVHNTDRE
jgi:hypothetical protein